MVPTSHLRLLAVVTTAAFMLAACGGDSDDSSDNTPTTGPCANVGNYTGTQIPTADEQNCIVQLHNEARAEVGVPDLAWSDTVAGVALTYARKLASQHNCALVHSTYEERNHHGENLAGHHSVRSGTAAWLAEKSLYTPGTPMPTDESDTSWRAWGHYTQAVWRSTTEIGCAYATCSSSRTVSMGP